MSKENHKEVSTKDLRVIEKTLAYAMGVLALQIDGSFWQVPKMNEKDKIDAIDRMLEIRSVYNNYFDPHYELAKQLSKLKAK